MRAMVLAAGVGSRLEPLTNHVPKPMVPVANRPVMQHIIELLAKHGIKELMSNLHYQPDKIRDYFGDGSQFGVSLDYLYEKELSGDAGGVRACRNFLQGSTFIVLMGDLLTDANLTEVIAQHKAKGALATIALKQVDDVQHFGVAVTDAAGFITGFKEKPEPHLALSDHASTGIYVLEPEVFEHIAPTGPFGFGRQLFPQLVAAGFPVLGVRINDYYWSDVGTLNQYRQSNFDTIEERVNIVIPGHKTDFGFVGQDACISKNAKIEGRVLVGANSVIESGACLKGRVLIGDNCLIGANAQLEDVIVWSNVTVDPGSVLRNCVADTNRTVVTASH